jgi:plasmid stabilization system protein ParE
MSQIVYSEQARLDLNRLFIFLAEKEMVVAQRAMLEIDTSISKQLSQNPKICREIGFGLRELIIDFGKSGYIALFDYKQEKDIVEILAIRHQLENNYKD